MIDKTTKEQLRLLFFQPTAFFKKVKSEKDWRKSVKWALVTLGVYVVLTVVMWAVLRSLSITLPEWTGVVTGDISILVVSLLIILISFFFLLPYSRFVQWIAVKLGGKGSRDDTTKIIFYGEVVSLSGAWLPIVNWLFGVWSFYVMYRGFRVLHSFSRGRAIAAILLPALIIFMILFALMMIVVIGFVALIALATLAGS